MKRSGIVALVGRPNTGKSTLLNNLIGTKVSITSPKPQTTRFPVEAVLDEERGQIIFVDTPGIFEKSSAAVVQITNKRTYEALKEETDLILYLVDRTRPKGAEENKVLGIIRKLKEPKILVINKIDITEPDFSADYEFMKDEFSKVIYISALKGVNIGNLLNSIFDSLPEKEPLIPEKMETPLLNIDSKKFIEELIREKVLLNTRDEVPYSVGIEVSEISERPNGSLYIKGEILVLDKKYKGMIISSKGRTIKEIGRAVRKELEVSTGKKVFVDLTVEADKHWIDRLI